MTDLSNSNQPDTSREPSKTDKENIEERGDIVRRTSLSLPSLSGFEQTPFSPSSDWQERDSTASIPAVSIWEEVPLPSSPSPTTERRLAQSNLPEKGEEARSPFPQSSLQSDEQVVQSRPAFADKRASTQNRGASSLKKVRLRPFEIVTLLSILIFGTFAYVYAYAHMPRKISTPVFYQSSNAITIVAQKSNTITTVPQGTKSFQVGAYPVIIIKGGSGNVNVHAGSAGSATVEINNTDDHQGSNASIEGVQLSQSRDAQGHDNINIATTSPNGDANYNITVPETAQVDVELGSGSIAVDGVSGVTVTTNSGKLNIENVNGPVNVSMQSGDVITHNVKGQMSLETVNGSINVKSVTGQLKAVTQNGDVNVKQAELSGQSSLKTSYGSIYFMGSIDSRGTYTMETRSGNINLTFPGDAAFQLHGSTGSGSINNQFGSDSVGNAPQAQVTATIGSGSITVSKSV